MTKLQGLKGLKFEKIEKTNFGHFVSCPLGEKVLRIVLTKVWTFKSLDALEAPKSKKAEPNYKKNATPNENYDNKYQ